MVGGGAGVVGTRQSGAEVTREAARFVLELFEMLFNWEYAS
jgi:hypothetical protein